MQQVEMVWHLYALQQTPLHCSTLVLGSAHVQFTSGKPVVQSMVYKCPRHNLQEPLSSTAQAFPGGDPRHGISA